jgi:hypothetical protein
MDTYKNKYYKYKSKYNQLKKGIREDIKVESKEIDWYLFFDLFQVSQDILNLTHKDDKIILVGDTPSYLTPFLEKYRFVFNLAFSNKPFGCFYPPYSEFIPEQDPESHPFGSIYSPTMDNLNKYFSYLDKDTVLTRKFVNDNWTNIVLVDSSSGASITGVSIFLNRYIGNIIEEQDGKVKCQNIQGCGPLQFIRLLTNNRKTSNISPSTAKEYQAAKTLNYNPELIIYIGDSIFYHRDLFMIYDAYPRILPYYYIGRWHEPPVILHKFENLEKGYMNIDKLKSLLDVYRRTKDEKNITDVVTDTDIDIELVKTVSPIYVSDNNGHEYGLSVFFDDINLEVLSMKYDHYFGLPMPELISETEN